MVKAVDVPLVSLGESSIPIIGLGTWKSPPGKVKEAVIAAIEAGYRHIDCALVYENEKEIGEAISEKIVDGTVTREELFITTKVWNTFHRRDLVAVSLGQSLSALGLNYVDLTLVHWPMGYKEGDTLFPKDESGNFLCSEATLQETWEGMENLVHRGLTRMIGVSNFNSKQLQYILDIGKIKPVVNQVESHPWLVQTMLINFCQERGIAVEAYSPLGSPDRPWAKKDDPVLLAEPILQEIAGRHAKTVAQICIRFQVQRGVIALPKSVTPERIAANIDVFDFVLSDADMRTIEKMNKGKLGRCCPELAALNHPDYPFHEDF